MYIWIDTNTTTTIICLFCVPKIAVQIPELLHSTAVRSYLCPAPPPPYPNPYRVELSEDSDDEMETDTTSPALVPAKTHKHDLMTVEEVGPE